MELNIKLLAFSGREDPSWTTSDEESKVILDKFKSSKDLEGVIEFNNAILGYKGFVIESKSKDGELPDNIIVYNNAIIWSKGKSRIGKTDDQSLEKYLLDLAKKAGYSELLEALKVE